MDLVGYAVLGVLVLYALMGLGIFISRILGFCKEKKHGAVTIIVCFLFLTNMVVYALTGFSYITTDLISALPFFLIVLAMIGFVYFIYKWKKLSLYTALLLPIGVICFLIVNYNFAASYGATYLAETQAVQILLDFTLFAFVVGVVYGAKEKFLK